MGHVCGVVSAPTFSAACIVRDLDREDQLPNEVLRCSQEEEHMPQWMLVLVLVLTAIAAASSTYTAYKIYQIGETKSAVSKSKR